MNVLLQGRALTREWSNDKKQRAYESVISDLAVGVEVHATQTEFKYMYRGGTKRVFRFSSEMNNTPVDAWASMGEAA